MNHEDVAGFWNANANAWTELARAGYDVYRDYFNTPAFFEMLPDVEGRAGLDLGCGEGHNTRLLAQRGARVAAIDIAEDFIAHARQAEAHEPLGIDYRVASAVNVPFDDATFDFATGFMSLMDMSELARVLSEAWRVLKPGGFLQFSIAHPCFDTPHRRNLRNANGLTYALEVGDYFRNRDGEVAEWVFGAAPLRLKQSLPKFKTPRFTRTLSQWLNLLIDTGFRLERVSEPRPSDEIVRACPALQDAQVAAFFLHVRVRKPEGAATHGAPSSTADCPNASRSDGSSASISDDAFLRLFEERDIPRSQWTHQAHLRVAYLYLTRLPFDAALKKLRAGIRGYNQAKGIQDSPTGGYHETMTCAFLRLIHAMLIQFGEAASSEDFCDSQPQLGCKQILRLFYSRERIMSAEAMARFVEPDLAPLPKPMLPPISAPGDEKEEQMKRHP